MRIQQMKQLINEQREQLKDSWAFSQKLQNRIWDYYNFFRFLKIIALFIALLGVLIYFIAFGFENE